MMVKDDWELFTMNRDGTGNARVTREIQHDIAPIFLTADRILAAMGEPRHRRSYLYDLPEMIRTRLFHNNTVRTIAPEYSWTPSPDGTKVLIAAERDGDTVSAERGPGGSRARKCAPGSRQTWTESCHWSPRGNGCTRRLPPT